MTGGLMQLVAYGAQDVYLTANPQVTFFKQLYRRHSNFAMESIEQTFNGVANFGKRVTCTIARNGDLITKMYLQATLPGVNASDIGENTFSWIPYVGQFLIKSVEIEIGGQRIDKHYGDWLHIWNELTLPAGKGYNYLDMVNGWGGIPLGSGADCTSCDTTDISENICDRNYQVAQLAALGSDSLCCGTTISEISIPGCIPETTLYIPFEFWFNRHTGLALPLIALQYHEVKVNIEFNDLRYLCNGADAGALSKINQAGLVAASLYVDYIFLDTEERRRFAQVAHEYLIEQLQFTGEESVTSTSNKINMSFNHPVKELIWVVQDPANVACNGTQKPYCYMDSRRENPVAVAKVQLNGHDRFSEREGKYFNRVQPFQHHTASPGTGINVYSFALKPEDLQPSGSCNFSRIDTATLHLTLTRAAVPSGGSANVRIYAVNYNVLRIMSGMGGLAYSN
jgi:hypothetical protein